MAKKTLNPEGLFPSEQYGFSQIVVAQGSRTIYFSGQVAWDEEQNIVGEKDFKTQVWQSLENLKRAVEFAGGSLEDVVSLRIYIVDAWMEKSEPVSEGLQNFFSKGGLPVSTWIGVSCLARPDFLIEIEATAVLD